jgi:hypothetical protein
MPVTAMVAVRGIDIGSGQAGQGSAARRLDAAQGAVVLGPEQGDEDDDHERANDDRLNGQ